VLRDVDRSYVNLSVGERSDGSCGLWHGASSEDHPGIAAARVVAGAGGGKDVATQKKRILLVADHNAFREALAIRLDQEADLEVAWQAGSIADARDVHLDGVDVAIVDPFLPDGDGTVLIREVSVANPNALALVLSRRLDQAAYQKALGAGAAEVLPTNARIEEVIDAVRKAANAE
jgi:DNA-binding NtrC family response regulator